MNEMQSAIESFDNRLNQAEKRISKLKNQPLEVIQLKEKKEKEWNTVKKPTVIGHHEVNHVEVPEEEREGKGGAERLFKQTISENFLKLGKEIHICLQGAQRTPNRLNIKRST